MSDTNAFNSFANFVKTQMTGSGITVGIEKHTTEPTPYLILQEGPSRVQSKWLARQLIQGWLVVTKNDTEPLSVTMGKALKTVVQKIADPGFLEKYDYTVTPKQLVGSVIPELFEVTQDMSNDPNTSKKVITWVLNSNASR